MTLFDHLLKLYPTAKRTTLRRMVEDRRVMINGRAARNIKQPIEESDVVEVRDRVAGKVAAPAPALPFPIVYEDEDILVIDKPPGLLTSTGQREKRPTALAMVREYIRGRAPGAQVGLIHRLDRDASGLLIFSKNHQAYLSLKRQFFEHSVERIYLALVHGVPTPASGTIDSRLLERADGSVRISEDPRKGERAITHYELISRAKDRSLLRVRLETGKKHQIRVHLAARGVPIVNDPIYPEKNRCVPFSPRTKNRCVPFSDRLMLAAVALHIVHPRTSKPMKFQIDPPAQMTPAKR